MMVELSAAIIEKIELEKVEAQNRMLREDVVEREERLRGQQQQELQEQEEEAWKA